MKQKIKGIFLDLDGTVYWGRKQVEGAAEFVGQFKHSNMKLMFVTNRANRTPDVICNQLRDYGISCDREDILTAAQATAEHIDHGRVFYIGEDGLRQALEEQGLIITDDSPDYVVVSFDREFNYEKMKKACRLIDQGATFIATNPDQALRTEDGIIPGTGAIVAAVASGCGVDPIFIGKPETIIMKIALRNIELEPSEVIAVGDNLATDIPAGNASGMRTVLMLTGLAKLDDLENFSEQPTWIARDYAELNEIIHKNNQ
jgi:4-nitrophenyl phosphatase